VGPHSLVRIGIHTSISGSLEKAALTAARLGANTFQIFSASPRQWRAGTPDPHEVRRMRAAREKHDLYPLVIHDNYLINLASCDEDLRAKSVAAFRGEIERALAIGAEYLVAHPGSCNGHTVEIAIYTFCKSLV
jgi:deoxyribonuclease IV